MTKEEPLVTIEGGPEEPEVVEENLKQASKDEEAEKEEEEKRHAEKEKEALAVANQTIEYIESKSGNVSFLPMSHINESLGILVWVLYTDRNC